jgi:hypothetical protein
VTTRRFSAEVLVRIRWLPILVALLCLTGILWVLIQPSAWTSCLILVSAAVPLAILGRESDEPPPNGR